MERFTIEDVARIHKIKVIREYGNEVFCECPFCGNTKGKFSYIIKKGKKENYFHCWSCDEGGNAISLHTKLTGKYYPDIKDAIKEIWNAIEGIPDFHTTHPKKPAVEVQEAHRAPDTVCSAVYYELLNMLGLSPEHKADLLRRGFTEADIQRFRFRSTPKRDFKTTAEICRKLLKKGYQLEGIPGFYVDKFGKWNLNIPADGYLCPVFEGDKNLLLGFQIRMDEPRNNMKYLWLSSVGKERGVTSGTLSSYLPGKEGNPVLIVEGILKALAVYSLLKGEVTIVGVPGITCISGLVSIMDSHPNAVFVEAYDMDKAVKTEDPKEKEKSERIAKNAEKLRTLITDHNYPTYPLIWDMDENGMWNGNYKGLDDFLLAYDRKDLFVSYIREKAEKENKLFHYFTDAPEVNDAVLDELDWEDILENIKE